MPDRTIILDPANPIPFRVFDNGDGSFSLAIHDPAGIQVRTTHISSAQLLDLHNTPVELVPPAGAGKWIVAMEALAAFAHGTTPYTVGGSSLVVGQSSDPLTFHYCALPAAGALDQGADNLTAATATAITAGPASGGLAMRATSALTNGNGSLDVTVTYVVVG